MIEGFFDEYRWLSNFWEVEINYDGITYPSVEHYYVALKVNEAQIINVEGNDVMLTLQELRKYISEIENPGTVKKFGQSQLKIRKDWNDLKISIMRYGLDEKYKQEPFRTKLIETGDVIIQEGNNWNDRYWGVDLATGEGKNVLGKMIMDIRKKLIK